MPLKKSVKKTLGVVCAWTTMMATDASSVLLASTAIPTALVGGSSHYLNLGVSGPREYSLRFLFYRMWMC